MITLNNNAKEKKIEGFRLYNQKRRIDLKKKAQTESKALTLRMLQAAKTIERMVNQNIFDDISHGQYIFINLIFLAIEFYLNTTFVRIFLDYRYWDDRSKR